MSVFVLIALSGTLRHLGVALPDWFPAPQTTGPETDAGAMSIGMTVFLWIFLLPFIAIGAGLIASTLSYIFGRTEVRIQQNDGGVSTGVGMLSWRRRFDPTAVQKVRIESQQARNGSENKVITLILTCGRLVKFGSMLRPERLRFVGAALRKTLTVGRRH